MALSDEHIFEGPLPHLKDIYTCKMAYRILKDPSDPSNGLFSLLKSGKRDRLHREYTERLRKRFFLQAILYLNDSS